MASRLSKLEYKVNTVNKPEDKYYNVRQSPNVGWAGSITGALNVIPQGDEDIQRNGDAVFMKTIHVRCVIRQRGSGNQDMARIILFYDKDNSVASASDFWDASYLGSVNAPEGFKNHDNRFKTKVLLDRTVSLNNGTYNIRSFTQKVKLNHRVQFEAGTTTIATGALKLFMVTSSSVALDDPNIDFTARIYYTDV